VWTSHSQLAPAVAAQEGMDPHWPMWVLQPVALRAQLLTEQQQRQLPPVMLLLEALELHCYGLQMARTLWVGYGEGGRAAHVLAR
jgi:hypothetical protein